MMIDDQGSRIENQESTIEEVIGVPFTVYWCIFFGFPLSKIIHFRGHFIIHCSSSIINEVSSQLAEASLKYILNKVEVQRRCNLKIQPMTISLEDDLKLPKLNY